MSSFARHSVVKLNYTNADDVLFFLSENFLFQPRQAGNSGLVTTIVNLALQYGPVLFKTFFSGEGGAPPQNTDRIEELEIKVR